MKYILRLYLCMMTALLFGSYESAYESYQKGEAAKTSVERERHFNEALELYTQNLVEDGKLYYNVANCYYQLGEMGMAIWYYEKALKLLPREGKIIDNLAQAKASAQVQVSAWDQVKRHLLFPRYLFSSLERTMIFSLFALLFFITASLCIWMPRKRNQIAMLVVILAGGFFSISSLIGTSSKEAVFIKPALMRCDGGEQYKPMIDDLIREGEMCTLIEVSDNQEWVKIKKGSYKGFVRKEHLRPI